MIKNNHHSMITRSKMCTNEAVKIDIDDNPLKDYNPIYQILNIF